MIAPLTHAGVVAKYLFDQNVNNSAGAGYALTEIGGSGSYVQDSVWGETKYVLSLSAAQGLAANMSAWTGSSDTYTIVMDVNLSEVSSYQKLVSFDAANASDYGLYTVSYDFEYYGGNMSYTDHQDYVSANSWIRLAMTRSGNDRTLYVGTPGSMILTQSGISTETYALIGSLLTFMQNDSTQGGEDSPLKVSAIWICDSALNQTAIESIGENALVVISEHGNPVPSLGTNSLTHGASVTCSVDSVTVGLTNYNPTGWTMVGNDPESGTTNWFETALINDAVLTWNWETNYWLDVNITGNGSVSHSDGWYANDSEQTLVAAPDSGWLFMGWSGDASGTNNAVLMMDAPKTVMATFSDDADGDGLTNTEEAGYGSNPWLADTDGDGFDDAFEVAQGLNVTNDSSAVITYIENNGAIFDLYPSNVVLNVAAGQLLLETGGGYVSLNLLLEKSEDLVIWTNSGNAVEWNLSVDGNKQFFRVRSEK